MVDRPDPSRPSDDGGDPISTATLPKRSDGSATLVRSVHLEPLPNAAPPRLPKVGERFLAFELIRQIGEGSFARVFLSRQPALGNRLVVLKVSVVEEQEPANLAQLQHANIMPVFSVHRTEGLQAVCMPFLGSMVLSDLLRELRREEPYAPSGGWLSSVLSVPSRSGSRSLFEAMEPASVEAGDGNSAEPADLRPIPKRLDTLRHYSYGESVFWLLSRLADGLAHAHERGILHLDIKPANVLIADDGEPLLLDFNLSRDLKRRDSEMCRVGGTYLYMSPEQLQQYHERAVLVDARSDLFSLGIIAYELATRQHPFAHDAASGATSPEQQIASRSRRPAPVRSVSRDVSPAAASIIEHLLEPDLERRYQSAAEVAEDLNRYLSNRPLLHAPDPSPLERLGQWTRRHPRVWAALQVGLVAAVFIVALGIRTYRQAQRQAGHDAVEAYVRQRQELDELYLTVAGQVVRGRIDDAGVQAAGRLLGPLPDRRFSAAALEERQPYWSSEHVADIRAVAGKLALSVAAARLTQAAAGPDRDAAQLAVAVDAVRAGVRMWGGSGSADEFVRLARHYLPADALPADIAAYRGGGGGTTEAARSMATAAMLLQGDLSSALTRLEPSESRWDAAGVEYLRAVCLGEVGRLDAARDRFSAAVALMRNPTLALLGRAAIYHRQRDFTLALGDVNQVVERAPHDRWALEARAVALARLDRWEESLADLNLLIEDMGLEEPRLLANRAAVRAALARTDDPTKRLRPLHLEHAPVEQILQLFLPFGKIDEIGNPDIALDYIDAALRKEPDNRPALSAKVYVLYELLDEKVAALEILDRLLEQDPDHTSSRRIRAVLLAEMGHREEALADARRLLRHDDSAKARLLVAMVYAQTSLVHPGDRDTAIGMLAELAKGGSHGDFLRTDGRLDPIRDDPRFRRLLDLSSPPILH